MNPKAMQYLYTAALAVLIGAVVMPAQAAKNKPAPAPLSEQGQVLEKQYAKAMEQLHSEITRSLPAVSESAKRAYADALEAEVSAKAQLEAAQKALGAVNSGKGLVGHAKNHWIPKADRGIAKAKADLEKAKTQAERDAAQKELVKWQENRQAGLDALKERQAAYDKARENEPKLKQQVKRAEQELAQAKVDAKQTLAKLRLDRVLTSDKRDSELAKYVLMKEATPRGLAAFAQKSNEHKYLVNQLLGNGQLVIDMVAAEGAKDGNYGRAMQIYTDILKANPRAKSGIYNRLALAISLEHATPIEQRNAEAATDAPQHVDPVQRYKHYEQAYLDGELDPYFDQQSVWNLRYVVDGNEPNSVLTWGREMLRNYRPDLITMKDDRWRYVALVRTCVRYGSQENKNDKDELQFYQNILMNGGICGRRAFFGRFILRSFGVPTVRRPQKGHAALARWTPEGWVVCLGGGWGAGWAPTKGVSDLDFLAITQGRQTGHDYMQVARAQWIGDVMGESRLYGLNTGKKKPEFWNGVALNTQRNLAAKSKTLAAVGEELGEANESKVKYPFESAEISAKDREISVDRKGVITIPAAATSKPTKSNGKILFLDSSLGGKQMHYSRTGKEQDFEYTFDAPAAGSYALTMRVSTPSWKQQIKLIVNGDNNGNKAIDIELPHTVGLWGTSEPLNIQLVKGKNVLRFTRNGVEQEVAAKGFTIKDFTLTPAK